MRQERRRRGKFEIFYEILEKCQNPTGFTEIMRSVSESYALMKTFLKELKEKGFLIKKDAYWLTTSQGRSYIKLFEKLKNLIED